MKLPSESEINKLWGTEAKKISLHLKIRYVWEEDLLWHLHVIPDEMTTAQELRESWGEIDKAREELKRYQGTDPKWFSVALLLDLEQRKEKSSYGELAMDMNFDTLVFFLWSNDPNKNDNWRRAGQITFYNLLQALGLKPEAILSIEKDLEQSIKNGEIPWGLKDGPISYRRISDALVQFRKEKNNQKIVVKSPTTLINLTQDRITAHTSGYWEKAKKLLEDYRENEFDAYNTRWKARISELIKSSIEFSGLNSQ